MSKQIRRYSIFEHRWSHYAKFYYPENEKEGLECVKSILQIEENFSDFMKAYKDKSKKADQELFKMAKIAVC